MPVYVPLELRLIDQGEFLQKVNIDLDRVHRGLARYAEEHGEEAVGARAELTAKLVFKVVNIKDGVISIKGTTKIALPGSPESVSYGLYQEDDEGNLCVRVKRSGSDAADPRQGVLTTQAGDVVDPNTGEVKEK